MSKSKCIQSASMQASNPILLPKKGQTDMYVDTIGGNITVRITSQDFKTRMAKITIAYIKSLPNWHYDSILQKWTVKYSPQVFEALSDMERKSETALHNRQKKKKTG